jgi:hypothetical protein
LEKNIEDDANEYTNEYYAEYDEDWNPSDDYEK